MPPSLLKKCGRCRAIGPVYLVGNEMLCQGCAAKPPKVAYFGSVIVISALAFVAVMLVSGGLYLTIEMYLARQAQKQQNQVPAANQIQQPIPR